MFIFSNQKINMAKTAYPTSLTAYPAHVYFLLRKKININVNILFRKTCRKSCENRIFPASLPGSGFRLDVPPGKGSMRAARKGAGILA